VLNCLLSDCLRPAQTACVVPMSGYRTAASDSGDDRFKRRALELLEEGVCAESGDVFVSSWGGAYVVNVVMHRPEMARSWASDVVGLFDADYVCRGGMLLRGTDDKAVYVLVVTDRFIHE
jgi:hypothetical protein